MYFPILKVKGLKNVMNAIKIFTRVRKYYERYLATIILDIERDIILEEKNSGDRKKPAQVINTAVLSNSASTKTRL